MRRCWNWGDRSPLGSAALPGVPRAPLANESGSADPSILNNSADDLNRGMEDLLAYQAGL
jgi:hypothetical protein